MTKCSKCNRFAERLNFGGPTEYLDFVRLIIDVVSQGTFLLVGASGPLEDAFKKPWVGDVLSHHFQCNTCGRAFGLFADTYHGRANWKPEEVPSSD
jgi:hypothetical protein